MLFRLITAFEIHLGITVWFLVRDLSVTSDRFVHFERATDLLFLAQLLPPILVFLSICPDQSLPLFLLDARLLHPNSDLLDRHPGYASSRLNSIPSDYGKGIILVAEKRKGLHFWETDTRWTGRVRCPSHVELARIWCEQRWTGSVSFFFSEKGNIWS